MKDIKILLVDDEETFVNTLSERLNIRDLQNETVFNGERALEFVDDKEPDVMVLDLKMPGIDGMEVLRRVKNTYPDIKVIILTGHGSEAEEEEARKLGAYNYLRKPADIDTLAKSIKAAYEDKIRNTMAAVAFAEAGEFDVARDMAPSGD